MQVSHLACCWSFKCLLMSFLPTLKGITAVWQDGTPLVPSLANLSASSLSGIPSCPGVHTKVTLLNSCSFPSACIHPKIEADLVGVFASAAKAALLSQQMRILLYVIFLTRRSCALQDSHRLGWEYRAEPAQRNTFPTWRVILGEFFSKKKCDFRVGR